MKKQNKSHTAALKDNKILLAVVTLALLGAATYLFAGWYAGIDAETSIGPNIGLGILGLMGEAMFWAGALGVLALLVYRFVK